MACFAWRMPVQPTRTEHVKQEAPHHGAPTDVPGKGLTWPTSAPCDRSSAHRLHSTAEPTGKACTAAPAHDAQPQHAARLLRKHAAFQQPGRAPSGGLRAPSASSSSSMTTSPFACLSRGCASAARASQHSQQKHTRAGCAHPFCSAGSAPAPWRAAASMCCHTSGGTAMRRALAPAACGRSLPCRQAMPSVGDVAALPRPPRRRQPLQRRRSGALTGACPLQRRQPVPNSDPQR